jgi:hypothetical protein
MQKVREKIPDSCTRDKLHGIGSTIFVDVIQSEKGHSINC